MDNLITIVMHHYVRDIKYPNETRMSGYCIGISEFKKRLAYIMKRYSIITPDLFINAIKDKAPLPENPMLLTFDDGYIDHYRNVFPILMERGIKAFFFPSAMPIMQKKMLNTNKIQLILDIKDKERLHYEISKSVRRICSGNALEELEKIEAVEDLNEKEDLIWSYLEWELPRYAANEIIDYLFNRLINFSEKDLCEKSYMSLEQLMHMKQNGMHVGCHGYNHYCMSYVNDKTKNNEIIKSLKFLKMINGSDKDWIVCYPYGSFDKSLISIVRKRGCIAGFTTIDGKADLLKDNPYTLPRIDITNVRFNSN